MEKARCNTELYSNLRAPLNNVKPSNFWGSHQKVVTSFLMNVFKRTFSLLNRRDNFTHFKKTSTSFATTHFFTIFVTWKDSLNIQQGLLRSTTA